VKRNYPDKIYVPVPLEFHWLVFTKTFAQNKTQLEMAGFLIIPDEVLKMISLQNGGACCPPYQIDQHGNRGLIRTDDGWDSPPPVFRAP
jgi:hypothetical protein